MTTETKMNASKIAAEINTLAADNDASGTGQTAARTAALRLAEAGQETIIITPTTVGSDLNDKVRHARG